MKQIHLINLLINLLNLTAKLHEKKLAKWKTMVQMVAITMLFAWGLFDHYFIMQTLGMNAQIVTGILNGEIADSVGLIWKYQGLMLTSYGGLVLLWLAAGLTLVTGLDYFRKAMPYLRDPR